MNVQIGNWTVEKAGEGDAKILPVKLVANGMTWDKENERVAPEAFSKATVDWYLENGNIDWFHKSKKGKTDKERSAAILGRPTSFQWEKTDEMSKTVKPVVFANLTRKNSIVQDIENNLDAENNIYGASIGGGVLKARSFVEGDKKKKEITEMFWDHLAIAPKGSVVCPGTSVSMNKANGEINILFNDYEQFNSNLDLIKVPESEIVKAFEDTFEMSGDDLRKAILVTPETDAALKTGFTAMTRQSLEGGEDEAKLLDKIMEGLFEKSIGQSMKGIGIFMKAEGYSDDNIESYTGKLTSALDNLFQGE